MSSHVNRSVKCSVRLLLFNYSGLILFGLYTDLRTVCIQIHLPAAIGFTSETLTNKCCAFKLVEFRRNRLKSHNIIFVRDVF